MTHEMCPMPAFLPSVEMLRAMLPFLMSTAAFLSGYDVMRRSGLSKQTSYSVVHKLARAGWLSSRQERSNLRYRPRMLYTPTADGVAKAKAVLSLLRTST